MEMASVKDVNPLNAIDMDPFATLPTAFNPLEATLPTADTDPFATLPTAFNPLEATLPTADTIDNGFIP
jgi:hypothetical protein